MKSLIPRLIAASAFALASSGLSIAAQPVMKINGVENPDDVYLQSLDIQIEVAGGVASTRHTMVFKNKTDRALVGELTFPLPYGRGVTYYAMDINGNMREAVPAEKATAARILEETKPRRTNHEPLESAENGNFRALVGPIPANGTRVISIGYEEELTLENDSSRYRLHTAYRDPLEKISVTATVRNSGQTPIVSDSDEELRFYKIDENYTALFKRENYLPTRALSFASHTPVNIPQITMTTQPSPGNYCFLISVAPKSDSRKKHWADDLAIIWDVSLSGSQRGLKREMEILNIIFAEKKHADVHLYFLNNTLNKIIDKNTTAGAYKVSDGNWDGLKNALEKAVFDGGTDFSKINLDAVAGKEILFFSDGISTLSDADFIKNATAPRPIHCVVSSAKADCGVMKSLSGKTNGKFVNINALTAEQLKDVLLNETLRFLGTERGKSVREIYPSAAAQVYGNFSLSCISDADEAELTLLFGFGNTVEKRINVKLDAKLAGVSGNARKIWAQKKIAELDLDYEKNRAELTEFGRQFGVTTRNTSFIVLETLDDYIRHDIAPPPDLRDEYQRIERVRENWLSRDTERDMFNVAAAVAQNIKNWRNTDHKKKAAGERAAERAVIRAAKKEERAAKRNKRACRHNSSMFEAAEIMSVDFDAPTPIYIVDIDDPNADPIVVDPVFSGAGIGITAGGGFAAAYESYGAKEQKNEKSFSLPAIDIKPLKKDNDYLGKLTGKTAEDYQIYLNLRDDYASSPTFYFDMAEWFYTRKDKNTALRVLTSIADLDVENASLYRLLGYRLKEYGEYELEKFACQRVILLRPTEPQSYRDYALALADNGEAQAALDSLYGLLIKTPSENIGGRGYGIKEVLVTEINHLLAKNANLNTSKIDKRLIIDIPVDIRVVINWNMDAANIDLSVNDPNNEVCYHGNPQTRIGGRISADNTIGYGPEQFLLKKAKRGKYRVYANYYGGHRFTDAGPTIVMAEIYTKYADKTERRQVVCLQMSNAKKKHGGMVEVAEFVF